MNDIEPIEIEETQEVGCLLGLDENLSARRKHRVLMFHVLYALDAFDYDESAQNIANGFNLEYNTKIDPQGELVTTVNSIGSKVQELDDTIIPFLENWKFERIGKCTLLSLRIAIWEMLYTKTAHSIIINEAIEIAKFFAEKDAYKFVNGMLDKISQSIKEKSQVAEEDKPIEE